MHPSIFSSICLYPCIHPSTLLFIRSFIHPLKQHVLKWLFYMQLYNRVCELNNVRPCYRQKPCHVCTKVPWSFVGFILIICCSTLFLSRVSYLRWRSAYRIPTRTENPVSQYKVIQFMSISEPVHLEVSTRFVVFVISCLPWGYVFAQSLPAVVDVPLP